MATLQFPGPSRGDGLGKSRQATADLRDLIEAVVAVCFCLSVAGFGGCGNGILSG